MAIDSFFDPLLAIDASYLIISVSVILSLIITLIYKWMTDQHLMKSLKDDIKKHQEEMKKHRNDPKKIMNIQKQAMEKNMQYMMKSMKPTIVTFIPLILVFGWLNAHFTYDPIHPNTEFSITANFQDGVTGTVMMTQTNGIAIIGNETQDIINGKATWHLKGDAGAYLLEVNYDGSKYTKEVLISDSYEYAAPVKNFGEDKIKSLQIDASKLRVFGEKFNIFGWHPGWLGVYIIISLISSMTLRKLMKLY